MLRLREYIIPIKGLVKERYRMEFNLTDQFFSNFANSPIKKADLKVVVNLDKKPSLMLFDIQIDGRIGCNCDRCLADIMLPVSGEYELMVKLEHESDDTEGDDEIVFIDSDESHFDLSGYLYEFAALTLPIKKTYDCRAEKTPPCDWKVLKRLEKEEEEEEKNPGMKNIWDEIKRELKN